jgi:hypothetical protein
MKTKQQPMDICDTFDEISSLRCSLDEIIFIKNAMFETTGACTPASLLEHPIADIIASCKKIEDFLKTID